MNTSMREIMNPYAITRDPAFPNAPEDWDPQRAIEAAQADALALGEEHWEAIRALQGYFAANLRPNMRALHDALDEHFHARGGLKFLYGLFPGGPVAQGCRYAGLATPAGSVDPSFGSVA